MYTGNEPWALSAAAGGLVSVMQERQGASGMKGQPHQAHPLYLKEVRALREQTTAAHPQRMDETALKYEELLQQDRSAAEAYLTSTLRAKGAGWGAPGLGCILAQKILGVAKQDNFGCFISGYGIYRSGIITFLIRPGFLKK